MRIGYFDCFSGASGDMILGALVAAGLDAELLRSELVKLNLSGYELAINPLKKQGFAAIKVDVTLTDKPGHRHLHHITKIIDDSSLTASIKDKAKRIFTRLAEAEARVHGTTVESVHFHEVGAVDAIVDVVGSAIGVDCLGLQKIICSPIPVGSGTVKCDHGIMPIPAPATAELLRGVPIAPCDEVGEMTTPTGAAILTTLADDYGPLPNIRIERIGYGSGTRDGKTRPNLLRLLIGESTGAALETDQITVLETNLDDTTGEEIGHAFEALFAAGALDVFATPIFMKKNRPGIMLSVLAPMDKAAACEEALFTHTRTFGVRHATYSRAKLHRESHTVATPFGDIHIKIGSRGDRVVVTSPEYDDCAAAAKRCNVPLRDVMQAAQSAWREKQGGRP